MFFVGSNMHCWFCASVLLFNVMVNVMLFKHTHTHTQSLVEEMARIKYIVDGDSAAFYIDYSQKYLFVCICDINVSSVN